MGIQINGQTDTISAVDGTMTFPGTVTYEDVSRVNVTGVSTFAANVHVSDSIVHLGDTDTSIRFPAADTFTVETAGNEALRIDSSGRVLVGSITSNTHDRLTIVDPGDSFISVRSDAAADATSQGLDFAVGTGDRASTNLTGVILATIHSQSGGTLKSDLKFFTNAGNSITEKMRIDSAGNIGMGNIIPGNQNSATELVVGNTSGNHGITILTGANNDGVLNFNNGDNANLGGFLIYEHSTDSLRFGTAASDRGRFDSNGRLLLGATSSASVGFSQYARLQVQGHYQGSTDEARISFQRGESSASMSSGDRIAMVSFADQDGGEYALIEAYADSTPGSSD